MLRLATVVALALTATACLDEMPRYDVEVTWTTENPPPGIGTARVTYPAETVETRGYSGTARVVGDASSDEIEICVELGTYELTEEESTYCEFFADCEPSAGWTPMTDRQCSLVAVDQATVAFTF